MIHRFLSGLLQRSQILKNIIQAGNILGTLSFVNYYFRELVCETTYFHFGSNLCSGVSIHSFTVLPELARTDRFKSCYYIDGDRLEQWLSTCIRWRHIFHKIIFWRHIFKTKYYEFYI